MRSANVERPTQKGNSRKRLALLVMLLLLAATTVISNRFPVFAQEDTRAIGTVRVESNQP